MEPRSASRNLIGAYDAKTRFGDLVDSVERGEVFVITRRGHPVAKLVPFDDAVDRERARAAADRLMTFGDDEGIRLPKAVSVEDLINDGCE